MIVSFDVRLISLTTFLSATKTASVLTVLGHEDLRVC